MTGKNAVGAWLAALALTGAGVTDATVAAAQVNVSVDVPVPEVTISDPVEVTATTEPPDPVYEEQTDVPGPGYVWVGGSWGWTGSDWGWAPGRWLAPPEGRVYIEPYYERVGPNVVYVPGYWGARDAPHRSYGGERIRFGAPPRPPDYRRGERPHFEHRMGAPPGTRPAGFYEHARGEVRPLPHAAYRAAPHEAYPGHAEPQGGRGGRAPVGHEPGGPPREAPAAHAPHAMPAAHPAPAPHAGPAPRKK